MTREEGIAAIAGTRSWRIKNGNHHELDQYRADEVDDIIYVYILKFLGTHKVCTVTEDNEVVAEREVRVWKKKEQDVFFQI